MRGKGRTPLLLLAAAVIGFAPRTGAAESQAPDASVQDASFEQHCAACHAVPTTRAPPRSAMRAMSPSFIVETLTSGMMKAQGSALTPEERVALAEYLTGRKVGAETPMAGRCAAAAPPLSLDGPSFNGWGGNLENWRFQPAPGLTAADLPRLELKWAFGVPGAVMMFGQPTVAAGRVFIGAQNGHVYALDQKSGCYYWDYRASGVVRTAITVADVGGRLVALFGDRRGYAYCRRRCDRRNDLEGDGRRRSRDRDHRRAGSVREPALCSDRGQRRRRRRQSRYTNAAKAEERLLRLTPRPAPSSGPRTRPRRRRCKAKTRLARTSSMALPAPRCGLRRQSTQGTGFFMSGPATTIPLRRPTPATQFWRSSSTTERSCGRNSC